jgi:hypothetical protein
MSLDEERWRDVYPLVRKLLPWAVEAHRSPPSMTDVKEGDLRLPFVTYELMAFVWRLVNREFSVVLADMLRLPAEPVEPPPDQEWGAEAIRLLITRLDHELEIRDQHLRGSNRAETVVRAEVKRLHEARRRAVSLAERLAAEPGRTLLEEIDALGLEFCGDAWVPLPRET